MTARYTVVGVLADQLGIASDPAQRTRAWATPASEVRAVQAPHVPIDIGHSHQWVGEVVYLERHAGNLWCVGEVNASPTVGVQVGDKTVQVETPMYWSPERIGSSAERPEDGAAGSEDIILRSVSVTPWPAQVSARPLTWYPGGLDRRSGWVLEQPQRGLIDRAGESRHTRHGQPLVIQGAADPPIVERNAHGDSFVDGQPIGQWRYTAPYRGIISVR